MDDDLGKMIKAVTGLVTAAHSAAEADPNPDLSWHRGYCDAMGDVSDILRNLAEDEN